MLNVNFKNLNTKEKMLIIKRLSDITTEIYKDNKTYILSQVLKQDDKQIRNDYGLFSTRNVSAKTVNDVIIANNEKIAKLQEENKRLEKLDRLAIVEEASTTLMSKTSELSNEIALALLEEVIAEFQSKRLEKSASKVANKK